MKPNVEQLDPDDVGSPEDKYWEGRYNYWFSEEARLEDLKRKLFDCQKLTDVYKTLIFFNAIYFIT